MKKKIILSSVLAIVMCMSMIVGGTFALFTSESAVNVAISSGKVDIVATLENLEVYSPTEITYDWSKNLAIITDETNATQDNKTFKNGGTAVLTSNSQLNIVRMTPGDEVDVDLKLQNNSNVHIKYQIVVSATSGTNLLEKLIVTFDGGDSKVEGVFNGTTIDSGWLDLTANAEIASIPINLLLSLDAGADYEAAETSLNITVRAVQGNATVRDITFNVVDDTTLEAAIEAKQDYTINEGTFKKVAVADGVDVTINGGKFENQIIAARNGATVTIKNASGREGNSGQAVIANINGGSTVIIEGGNYPLFNSLLAGDGTGTMIISGGYFDGGCFYWNMGGKPVASLIITGGTFGRNFVYMHDMMGPNISDFVPDTHQIINNADGSCTVVAK